MIYSAFRNYSIAQVLALPLVLDSSSGLKNCSNVEQVVLIRHRSTQVTSEARRSFRRQGAALVFSMDSENELPRCD